MTERLKGHQPDHDLYAPYKLVPFIQEAIMEDSKRYSENRDRELRLRDAVFRRIWGEGSEIPRNISPSTASNCLRWVGYEALGFPRAPRTVKSEIELMIGTASHTAIERKLYPYGKSEQPIYNEDAGISGRLDFILRNPALAGEYQIVDFKFVSEYAYRQIKREGLPTALKSTRDVYSPSPEYRTQILLYMFSKRAEGMNVTCGNIIYINRDTGDMKEALVLWDPEAEYEIQEFITKLKEARKMIDKGQLPEPSVVSSYICGSYCPYRIHCEYGQKFAAEKMRKSRERLPNWLYKEIKDKAEEKRKKLEGLGVRQLELGIDGKDGGRNGKGDGSEMSKFDMRQDVVLDKSCECGAHFVQSCRIIKALDGKGAKGRSYIQVEISCPSCGAGADRPPQALVVKNSQIIYKD
jgi:hypothetical protein